MRKIHNPHESEGFKTSTFTKPGIYFCVAVRMKDTIDVRDTKDEKNPTLSFTHDEWRAFIKGVKNGEFDLL